MAEKEELSGARALPREVKFDLSRRTGQHIRFIVRIPEEVEHEGQDQP